MSPGKKTKHPSIQVTRFDKTRLTKLLRGLDAAAARTGEIEDLERELARGIEVDSTEVPPDVITMNSTVRITDLDSGATHTYTIVFPAEADSEAGRISVLSPLGTALLGFRSSQRGSARCAENVARGKPGGAGRETPAP